MREEGFSVYLRGANEDRIKNIRKKEQIEQSMKPKVNNSRSTAPRKKWESSQTKLDKQTQNAKSRSKSKNNDQKAQNCVDYKSISKLILNYNGKPLDKNKHIASRESYSNLEEMMNNINYAQDKIANNLNKLGAESPIKIRKRNWGENKNSIVFQGSAGYNSSIETHGIQTIKDNSSNEVEKRKKNVDTQENRVNILNSTENNFVINDEMLSLSGSNININTTNNIGYKDYNLSVLRSSPLKLNKDINYSQKNNLWISKKNLTLNNSNEDYKDNNDLMYVLDNFNNSEIVEINSGDNNVNFTNSNSLKESKIKDKTSKIKTSKERPFSSVLEMTKLKSFNNINNNSSNNLASNKINLNKSPTYLSSNNINTPNIQFIFKSPVNKNKETNRLRPQSHISKTKTINKLATNAYNAIERITSREQTINGEEYNNYKSPVHKSKTILQQSHFSKTKPIVNNNNEKNNTTYKFSIPSNDINNKNLSKKYDILSKIDKLDDKKLNKLAKVIEELSNKQEISDSSIFESQNFKPSNVESVMLRNLSEKFSINYIKTDSVNFGNVNINLNNNEYQNMSNKSSFSASMKDLTKDKSVKVFDNKFENNFFEDDSVKIKESNNQFNKLTETLHKQNNSPKLLPKISKFI